MNAASVVRNKRKNMISSHFNFLWITKLLVFYVTDFLLENDTAWRLKLRFIGCWIDIWEKLKVAKFAFR